MNNANTTETGKENHTKGMIALIMFISTLLALGIGYIVYTRTASVTNPDQKVVEKIPTDKPSEHNAAKKETFAEETEWYETKIEFPENNKTIKEKLLSAYDEFIKDTDIKTFKNLKDAQTGLYLSEGMKYTFNATYETTTSQALGQKTTSYIYTLYTFTGGAHGSSNIVTFTTDQNGNIIQNTDILPDASLQKVSGLTYKQVLSEKNKRLLGEASLSKEDRKSLEEYLSSKEALDWAAEGTKPERTNYQSIALDGDNLLIYIGQYQVGPYAEGMYTIQLPYSSVK